MDFWFVLGTTVGCVTTGVSESVDNTPRPLVAGERLLVCPRSDKFFTIGAFLFCASKLLEFLIKRFLVYELVSWWVLVFFVLSKSWVNFWVTKALRLIINYRSIFCTSTWIWWLIIFGKRIIENRFVYVLIKLYTKQIDTNKQKLLVGVW